MALKAVEAQTTAEDLDSDSSLDLIASWILLRCFGQCFAKIMIPCDPMSLPNFGAKVASFTSSSLNQGWHAILGKDFNRDLQTSSCRQKLPRLHFSGFLRIYGFLSPYNWAFHRLSLLRTATVYLGWGYTPTKDLFEDIQDWWKTKWILKSRVSSFSSGPCDSNWGAPSWFKAFGNPLYWCTVFTAFGLKVCDT